MKTALEIYNDAFHSSRTARSPEYHEGVLAALRFRVAGEPMLYPYPVGFARADAWFAGTLEGHALWRAAKEAA